MADGVTKEEIEALQKDIEAAKQTLVMDATNKVAAEASAKTRAEVEKEFELKKALDEQARLTKEAQDALAKQKTETEAALNALKSKMDSLIASRAPVRAEDPFASATPKSPLENLTEAQAEMLIERANEDFFGPEVWQTIKKSDHRY